MPKKGLTAVKVTFMTMTLVTLVTAVKFDYGTVENIDQDERKTRREKRDHKLKPDTVQYCTRSTVLYSSASAILVQYSTVLSLSSRV